jgi:hypothetical protein
MTGYHGDLVIIHLRRMDFPWNKPSMNWGSPVYENHHMYIKLYIYIQSGWWFGTFFIFHFIYWEFHHPNWRTHIFQMVNISTYFTGTAPWRWWLKSRLRPAPWASTVDHHFPNMGRFFEVSPILGRSISVKNGGVYRVYQKTVINDVIVGISRKILW